MRVGSSPYPRGIAPYFLPRKPGQLSEAFLFFSKKSWNLRADLAAAELLLKHGASLAEGSTDAQLTPLHAAAASGHFKLLEYLLGRKGASVGALDSAGATPLHHAARSASEKGVLALLQWGADPKVADAEGKTARDVVAGTDSFSVRVRDAMDNAAKIHAEAVEAREKKRAEKAAAKEKEAGKAEL